MDSLADHSSRRSESTRTDDGALRLTNRLLLLAGALLFVNGITITLITALIPVAVDSLVIAAVVTGIVAVAYAANRYPNRFEAFWTAIRTPLSTLRSGEEERHPRQQGGL